MKTRRIERLMTINLLLTLAACTVRSASTPVPSSIISPPTASAPIVPITITPVVAVQIMPPVSPTATPDCQPAAGVTIEVRRLSDTTAVLHASGLQPGEIPFVFYSTSIIGHSMRGEASGFAKGVDEHGEFSFELGGLQPLEGQARATWDIRLVHRRGVACAAITLP